MRMTKTIAATIALMATTATAQEPLNIATGKAGGGYDRAAQTLSQRLTQRGVPNVVLNKNGSDEISLALCNGSADIGYMQMDAIWARAQEGCELKPVGAYGAEVAYLLFPPDSKKDKLDDLNGTDKVGVDTVGSGSELFWRTIVKIETGDKGNKSKWAQAATNIDGLAVAIAAGLAGDMSALVLVRKPDSPDIRRLLDAGWELGELYDKDINDLTFKDKPLYGGGKVQVLDGAGKKHRGYGYEVNSFLAVNPSVQSNPQLFGLVATVGQ